MRGRPASHRFEDGCGRSELARWRDQFPGNCRGAFGQNPLTSAAYPRIPSRDQHVAGGIWGEEPSVSENRPPSSSLRMIATAEVHMHEDERAGIFEFMRTMGLRAGATDGHRMTWRHRYRPGRRRPRDLRQYRIAERVCQL